MKKYMFYIYSTGFKIEAEDIVEAIKKGIDFAFNSKHFRGLGKNDTEFMSMIKVKEVESFDF